MERVWRRNSGGKDLGPPAQRIPASVKVHSHLLKILTVSCISEISLLNHVQLFATPWTVAYQASLSFTISWSLLKLIVIESVMLSNHLTLCCPLLLLPSVFHSSKVFSNESALCIRWP